MASMGLNEVLNYPFISLEKINNLGIKPNDERQNLVRLANPLSEDLPYLRSTLLPGLFDAVIRNISRGNDNLALFEQGSVYLKPKKKQSKIKPQLLRRPSSKEIQLLDDLIPVQPKMISSILTGEKYNSGWWPNSQKYSWHDPIEMVARLCEEYGIKVSVKNANNAPFHPGRCAEISIGEKILGYAGEFNPSVLEKIGINGKVYGFEIEGDLIVELAQVIKAPVFSSMPVVKEDLAFVVAKSVTAKEVIETIKKSSGDLLESVRLFDVYEGANVGEDKKSLAFSLRFRAFDRTLNSEEISTLRGQIIETVQQRHRGSLRA
jgi:phenylalanyl-tRNA synthetase beta chain